MVHCMVLYGITLWTCTFFNLGTGDGDMQNNNKNNNIFANMKVAVLPELSTKLCLQNK